MSWLARLADPRLEANKRSEGESGSPDNGDMMEGVAAEAEEEDADVVARGLFLKSLAGVSWAHVIAILTEAEWGTGGEGGQVSASVSSTLPPLSLASLPPVSSPARALVWAAAQVDLPARSSASSESTSLSLAPSVSSWFCDIALMASSGGFFVSADTEMDDECARHTLTVASAHTLLELSTNDGGATAALSLSLIDGECVSEEADEGLALLRLLHPSRLVAPPCPPLSTRASLSLRRHLLCATLHHWAHLETLADVIQGSAEVQSDILLRPTLAQPHPCLPAPLPTAGTTPPPEVSLARSPFDAWSSLIRFVRWFVDVSDRGGIKDGSPPSVLRVWLPPTLGGIFLRVGTSATGTAFGARLTLDLLPPATATSSTLMLAPFLDLATPIPMQVADFTALLASVAPSLSSSAKPGNGDSSTPLGSTTTSPYDHLIHSDNATLLSLLVDEGEEREELGLVNAGGTDDFAVGVVRVLRDPRSPLAVEVDSVPLSPVALTQSLALTITLLALQQQHNALILSLPPLAVCLALSLPRGTLSLATGRTAVVTIGGRGESDRQDRVVSSVYPFRVAVSSERIGVYTLRTRRGDARPVPVTDTPATTVLLAIADMARELEQQERARVP